MIDARVGGDAILPVAVMTRLRLSGLRSFVRFLWAYRRLRRTLDCAPGFMHAQVLFEGPLTVQIISIWRTTELMHRWVGIPEHVHAIHDSYAGAREVYSARWRLELVSPSARRWHAAPAMEVIAELSRTCYDHPHP